MNKNYFLILITVVVINGGFILSGDITNATTINMNCHNGPSNTDSGGCGTACVNLCNITSFTGGNENRQSCRDVMYNTDAWSLNNATRRTITFSCSRGTCARIEFSFFRARDLCSIGDKCAGDTCGTSPFLRHGNCECGGVGGVYKICCDADGNPRPAIRADDDLQDGIPPDEGVCPPGARAGWSAETEARSRRLSDGRASNNLVVRGEGTALTCAPFDGALPVGPVTPLPPPCVTLNLVAVTADIGVTPSSSSCLPFHATRGGDLERVPHGDMVRATSITWGGRPINICGAIIGGGNPNPNTISCRNGSENTGWVFNETRSGALSGTVSLAPTVTQSYTVECTRAQFQCIDTSRTFDADNNADDRVNRDNAVNACNASCSNLNQMYPHIASCTCSSPACVRHGECLVYRSTQSYTVGGDSGTTNFYDDTEDGALKRCNDNCQNTREVAKGQVVECECDAAECARRRCLRRRSSQTVTSKQICSSSARDSQRIKVIQQPRLLRDNGSLITAPTRSQILLNQLINLVWDITKPSSGTGVNTTMRCTPSVASGGDGEGWATGLDSIIDPSNRRDGLSPDRTTNYQLFCRNRYDGNPNQCFRDSDMVSREVRVFTPDLREVPAFYDGFMRIVGMVTNSFQKNIESGI